MEKHQDKTRSILGLSLSALAGLALFIQPGPSGTANAADETTARSAVSSDTATTPTGTYTIKGRFYNSPPAINCKDIGATPVCAYEIKGYSVTSDGERYQHSIVGTSHGSTKAPNDKSQNRSYVIWEFKDGSTVLMQSQGVATVDANGQLSVAGTQVCIDGTGRFANVDCTIDWSHSGHNDGRDGGVYEGVVTPKKPS